MSVPSALVPSALSAREGGRMRSSNFGKSEAGQILVYVTITLALSLLVIPPLLGFIFGAGRTAQIREDRMLQVYAADAGIEDGYYRIMGNTTDLPEDPWTIENVNGYQVTVAVSKDAGDVYKIVSTATDYTGADVTIEAYAVAWDYSHLLNSALSSYGNITLQPGVEIHGNVTLNGEIIGNPKQYDINGSIKSPVPSWPKAEQLSAHYWGQVSGTCPDETELGECYVDGDLSIGGGGNITLTGTVYIKGDLWANAGTTVDLNGHTIYAEGSINFQPNSHILGPGCLIAVGDVNFKPHQENQEYIFVMSINGLLTALPGSDFYGSFAGRADINLQPNNFILWIEYPIDLNFPVDLEEALPGIMAYIIRT